MLPLQMTRPHETPHHHGRGWLAESGHFLICAGGILICYFVFGIQQERIVQGKYELPDESTEKFTFTQALVFFLCTGNTIYAYLIRKKSEIDNVPAKMYAASAASYLLAMVASNQALQYLPYPTQVLAKSCKPIPVMIFGVLFAHKSYHWRKYCYVLMIVIGVAMFLYKDKKAADQKDFGFGEALLIFSLAMDGTTTSIQDRIKKSYQRTGTSMMFYTNLYSSLYLSAGLLVSGELWSFFYFVQRHPYVFWDLTGLAIASCLGQWCIFKTIEEFSPLTCSIVTTTRKLFTIIISVLFMNHPLSGRQILATTVVFSALTADVVDGKLSSGGAGDKKPLISSEDKAHNK
uniref:UAA transporter n=1 Tax=Caenorhabditis tropicalis TaxID=1561998 RepID=A0A1I7U8S9_9PELO